jgi:hypothetical protein
MRGEEGAIVSKRNPKISEARARLRFAVDAGVTTLYKFKAFEGRSVRHVLGMLQDHRIFFSSQSQLNDVFDNRPAVRQPARLQTKAGRRDYIQRVAAMLRRQRPRLTRSLIRDQLSQLNAASSAELAAHAQRAAEHLRLALDEAHPIFCLSRTQMNPLMWAHYAAAHTGVCIHFDARADRGSPFAYARRVQYRGVRPALEVATVPPAPDVLIDVLALTKSREWAYEQEFRLLGNLDHANGFARLDGKYAYFDAHLITGCTIGFAMSKRRQQKILAAAKAHRPALRVWRTRPHATRYALELEEIGW